jgi:hypothetical protein
VSYLTSLSLLPSARMVIGVFLFYDGLVKNC